MAPAGLVWAPQGVSSLSEGRDTAGKCSSCLFSEHLVLSGLAEVFFIKRLCDAQALIAKEGMYLGVKVGSHSPWYSRGLDPGKCGIPSARKAGGILWSHLGKSFVPLAVAEGISPGGSLWGKDYSKGLPCSLGVERTQGS